MLETRGLTPAIVALDAMEKRAPLTLIQAELNDFLGVVIKVAGQVDAVAEAVAEGRQAAAAMQTEVVVDVIRRVDPEAWAAIHSPAESNALIQQDVVHFPGDQTMPSQLALGLIETQGFTAVFEAIDTACKAAQVEVVGKEKLGGGYITVVIRGDVAAVTAAIDAGREKVAGLGNLIAAHVIAHPSESVQRLLTALNP
jgi:ethanolamine utilization protein EutM